MPVIKMTNDDIVTVQFDPWFYSFLSQLPTSIEKEVGINFYISSNNIIYTGVFIKGDDSSVLSIGYGIIKAHIHPYALYKGEVPHQPPTCTDLLQSIWDTLGGTQFNIVFEAQGAWVYTVTPYFLNKLIEIDPSLEQYYLKPLRLGEKDKDIVVNDELQKVLEQIQSECVQLTHALVYHRDITVATYLSSIRNIVTDHSFFVEYVPYSTDLDLQVKITPEVNTGVLNNSTLEDLDIESFVNKMEGTYSNNVIH
jgi:hypothetical protein